MLCMYLLMFGYYYVASFCGFPKEQVKYAVFPYNFHRTKNQQRYNCECSQLVHLVFE